MDLLIKKIIINFLIKIKNKSVIDVIENSYKENPEKNMKYVNKLFHFKSYEERKI